MRLEVDSAATKGEPTRSLIRLLAPRPRSSTELYTTSESACWTSRLASSSHTVAVALLAPADPDKSAQHLVTPLSPRAGHGGHSEWSARCSCTAQSRRQDLHEG